MVQTALPTATFSNNWTVTGSATAHQALASPSDSSLIETNIVAEKCRVNIESLTDPLIGTGHDIKFRAKATGSGGGEKVRIRLFEGATQRALSGKISITRGSFNAYTFTLSIVDADTITDYTDLRIEIDADTVGGSENLEVSEIFLEIPDASGGGGDNESESAEVIG